METTKPQLTMATARLQLTMAIARTQLTMATVRPELTMETARAQLSTATADDGHSWATDRRCARSHSITYPVKKLVPLTTRSCSLKCVSAAEHHTAEQYSKTGGKNSVSISQEAIYHGMLATGLPRDTNL